MGETNGTALVLVGTGKFLGSSDLTVTQQQSFYAIKDKLDTVTFGNLRVTANRFIRQAQTKRTCPATAPTTLCLSGQIIRTTTNNVVNYST